MSTPYQYNRSLLPLILAASSTLAEECRSVRFPRSAASRHTRIQRYLIRAAIPLRSLSARLRRRLIPESNGDELSCFTAFARSTLFNFHNDLLGLFRALDNSIRRRNPTLTGLVERTMKAVSVIEERERVMILNAVCCA